MPTAGLKWAATAWLAALPLGGWALCTSDGVAQPQAVLERFVNADCEACWSDPATPAPAADTVALDWVVPGAQGDDAPLSAVASREALDRLATLRRPVPPRAAAHTRLRKGAPLQARVALGSAFNDYIGATIALRAGGRPRWDAWLLLVEELPAGTEGSPVARNLVRNVFRPDWGGPASRPSAPGPLNELRPMQIHAGARPERLRLVALVADARGDMRAIVRTECRE